MKHDKLAKSEGCIEWSTSHGVGVSFPPATEDKDIELLREEKGIVWINLQGTKITDAGLEELKHLRGIESVRLVDTSITTAGLFRLLTKVPSIQEVVLSKKVLSPDEVAKFKKTFPHVKVVEVT